MKISRKKGPLYTQVKDILKDRILHGRYAMDEYIPAEPQLEAEFSVSKITVRKAIEELVQEGFLEKRSGKGTKVIRNTSTSKLSKGKRFTEYLVESGHQLYKQLIESKEINNEKDSKLYTLFGEKCICMRRLYHLDDKPYIYFTHYLTEQMEDILHEKTKDRSLYQLIEQQAIHLENFTDNFAIATAPPEVAELLNVEPGKSLLKRMRYSYDEFDNLIEYSEGYYNTELQEYVVTYNK
ncbi:GntR family transcriptional regulator [Gracilibacillus oryzae]|uniref:GntR family transcriptional regulator n=1 Tax=Gracilibacillus oryzae TaxID=1672701 RepID=A0A7C8GRB2_9BACI|nr:GntR family transcriptional regulator [Gracilibacillus oryzae]KAB8127097.1 GntR family transcriptional regulator [Gracilibacillus oryzae]